MYNLLVADDEPRHRRGIKNIIKKIRPQYSLFEARDGEEALQIINSKNIDIIITDIKMPDVDGLQLIEHLGQKIKTIKVVILSAYGYFDYAKKAISLGAFEYLLKPIEEDDIKNALHKVEKSIEKDHQLMQERVNIEKKLNDTMPAYLEHLLARWMAGDGLTQAERREIDKLFPEHGQCILLAAGIQKSELDFSAKPANDESDAAELAVKYSIEQTLKPFGTSVTFFMRGKGNVLVTILCMNGELYREPEAMLNSVMRFIHQIKTDYGLGITVGMSDPFQRQLQEPKLFYAQALNSLDYEFYYGSENVIRYGEIPLHLNETASPKYGEENMLSEAIIQFDREKAALIVDNLFNRMIVSGYQTPPRVKETVKYIVLNVAKSLEHLLLKEQFHSLIEQVDSILSVCRHFDELKRKVKEIVFFMITSIENRKNNKNSAIIEKCKHYIEENFMEDIPLETIARKFYFSPAYFSSFFKNYTGMGLSEFIMQARIKNAKELLIQTDERVHDISLKVGYKDQGYFTKVFKKEVGSTPDDFRRNREYL